MTYTDPQTVEDWEQVAAERGADAEALSKQGRYLAALYLIGYVVECYAKAMCTARNRKPGKEHDLIPILERAGFKRQELRGGARKFADERTVSLRYQADLPPTLDFKEEFQNGCELARWCKVRLRRTKKRRRLTA